jgi:hypothetical protein
MHVHSQVSLNLIVPLSKWPPVFDWGLPILKVQGTWFGYLSFWRELGDARSFAFRSSRMKHRVSPWIPSVSAWCPWRRWQNKQIARNLIVGVPSQGANGVTSYETCKASAQVQELWEVSTSVGNPPLLLEVIAAILILAPSRRRIQKRHRNVVKVIVKFYGKGVHFQ